MTPMPVNPLVVLLVAENGAVIENRSNLGNDLVVVVTTNRDEFNEKSAGVPYEGTIVDSM